METEDQTVEDVPARKARKTTVAKEVGRLLTGKSTLSYAKIAERVRKKLPNAHTTARSVASIAAGMRAAGADIPDRRKHV